jgi:transcriptional regulator with XRE-family HTH domain
VLGINQTEAGRRAGISRTQWTRIERGESGTRRENVPGIAKAIRTDLSEAYRRAGYAPPVREVEIPDFVERLNNLPTSVRNDLAVMIDALCQKYARQRK